MKIKFGIFLLPILVNTQLLAAEYVSIVKNNLQLITDLKKDCVLIEIDLENENPEFIAFDVYEIHDDICGGDPATDGSRLTFLRINLDDAGKPISLLDYDWGCDCFEIIKNLDQ